MEIGKNATLVFQTHVDATLPLASLNRMLDNLRSAAERQQAINAIEPLTAELEARLQSIELRTADHLAVEQDEAKALAQSGKRNPSRTIQSENARQQRLKLIEHEKADVKRIESALARAKAAADKMD
jgi:RNA polymerase-binding transcription factor DksA